MSVPPSKNFVVYPIRASGGPKNGSAELEDALNQFKRHGYEVRNISINQFEDEVSYNFSAAIVFVRDFFEPCEDPCWVCQLCTLDQSDHVIRHGEKTFWNLGADQLASHDGEYLIIDILNKTILASFDTRLHAHEYFVTHHLDRNRFYLRNRSQRVSA